MRISAKPTGGWPASTILTRTLTLPTPRSVSRRSSKPTRSSRTPRSVGPTTKGPAPLHKEAPDPPRVATSGRPRERTTGSVDLSGLLRKSGSSSGGRSEINWQLRVEDTEDLARISKILGVDLARLAKLAGKDVRMKTSASFENGGAAIPRNAATDGLGRKPRKPPIPPKPPKTRKPRDVP